MSRAAHEWREGVIVGLYTASILSAWAALVWTLGGAADVPDKPVSLAALIAAYFLAGLLGGSAYGLLYRLRRRLLGAIALGVVVCTLVYAVVALLFIPAQDWVVVVPVSAVFCGLVTGPVVGSMLWFYASRRNR